MKKAFTIVVEIMIVVVIVFLLTAMAIPMFKTISNKYQVSSDEMRSTDYKIYQAWIKENISNLTFAEWKLLRDAGLLQKTPQ